MKHELPPLPYPYNALEPYIDAKTMEVHYTKHHQTYVDKLNAALDKHPELYKKSLEELLMDLKNVPQDIQLAVRNNAGGHYNHSFFWKIMSPKPQSIPSTTMLEPLGGYDKFKEDFTKKASDFFGSGWVWLVTSKNQDLEIISTPNQDSPISQDAFPLLGIDLWEHAYYLKHQNKKADYIESWWHVVDWRQVELLYTEATKRLN